MSVHWADSAEVVLFIWATSWEKLFLPYANNKGADQAAHPHSRPFDINAYKYRSYIKTHLI